MTRSNPGNLLKEIGLYFINRNEAFSFFYKIANSVLKMTLFPHEGIQKKIFMVYVSQVNIIKCITSNKMNFDVEN